MSKAQPRREAHVPQAKKNIILSASATFGENFLFAVAEADWNARDAGAKEILIEFFMDNGVFCMRHVDDGIGMDETRRNAFLNYGDSQWLNAQARGKNGTGRFGLLHHGETLCAETKVSGGDLYATGFTADQFESALMRGTELYWEATKLPPRHPISTTGTVITIRNLGKGTGVNARAKRTAKRLIEGLAELLPIDLARIIRVKDTDGTVSELRQRKLRGQVIEGDHHDVPVVGDVSYRLGVVDRNDAEVDTVTLFARSRVCTFGEFLADVAKHDEPALHPYLKAIRAVLEHPLVSGIIDIPYLNRYVGDARNRVGEQLFNDTDALLAILRFLRETVVPRLENSIGLKANEIERSDDETVLRDLLADLGATAPGKTRPPGGPTTQTSLSVDETQFYVLCGQTHAIAVTDPRKGGAIAWIVRSGGTLDATVGERVTLTASSVPTRGEILVTETVPGEPDRSATIRPEVVTEFPFEFDMGRRGATPSQRITLKLRYPARVRGKIQWSVTPGGILETKGDPDSIGIEEAAFSAPYAGDFTVEASVPENGLLKVCVVTVAAANGGNVVSSSRSEFPFGTQTYEVQARSLPDSPDKDKIVIFPQSGGAGRWVLRINMANSQIHGQPDQVKKALLLLHIAQIVAEQELLAGQAAGSTAMVLTPAALRKKANEVYAELRARGTKKSKP